MQSTDKCSSRQNVLTETFPGSNLNKMVYLRSPGQSPPPRRRPSVLRASFPHDGRLTPIDALSFFQSKLRNPSTFAIKPQELQTVCGDGKESTTDKTLSTIYQTTRIFSDLMGCVEVQWPPGLPAKKATVKLEHVDRFTLDTLPEADLKALRATELLSEFKSIGGTIRSIDSIVPQITENLIDKLTSEEGKLMYLPLGHMRSVGDSREDLFKWMSETFPSEVEVTLEAHSDLTIVLPEHNSESTKKALRDQFEGRSFIVPAARLLREYAEAEPEA